jgi:glycosyltransferase involved in cell wall biosynthesis
VGELYRLADVMVLASLNEAFALVVPEALSCGLPVLVHDNPHFHWLTGSRGNLVNMAAPGQLADRLRVLSENGGERDRLRLREQTIGRFDWEHLRPGYLSLYERMMDAPIRNDLASTSTPWRAGGAS